MADYFTLLRVPSPDDLAALPQVATAAPIACGLCGEWIAGMGGPSPDAICDHCANLLRAGRLRGLVKRD